MDVGGGEYGQVPAAEIDGAGDATVDLGVVGDDGDVGGAVAFDGDLLGDEELQLEPTAAAG